METPSSIYTREEQQKVLTPHEYTGESISIRYQNCVSCRRRTEFTCVKCGYCYSCHWKREQIEQVELRDKLKDFYVMQSKGNEDNKQQRDFERKDEALEKWRTLDVVGQRLNQYATTMDVITSFHFMVLRSADASILQIRH